MSKKEKIILTFLIILGIFGVFFFKSHATQKQITELNFTDTISNPTTVYDFMNTLQKEGKINFTEKNYTGMGKFIESINGVQNNSNQSWIYYVNGTEAQVGVSNYKIKAGDIVSWKYEKSIY